MLKQNTETYLVFTLEWAKYPLVNTKVAVGCFADSVFVRDVKFRPACLVLSRDPPGSSIPGILQARALEWGAIAFSESKHETEDKNGLKQSRERRGSFRWEEL